MRRSDKTLTLPDRLRATHQLVLRNRIYFFRSITTVATQVTRAKSHMVIWYIIQSIAFTSNGGAVTL